MKNEAKKSSLKLIPHPICVPAGVEVTADIELSEQSLILGFRILGSNIRSPKTLGSPERKEGLWKETCFELFVPGEGDSYQEWNMSPTGDWQHYQFSEYRKPENIKKENISQPKLIRRSATEFQFKLTLNASANLEILKPACILKLASGKMSYWATDHFDSEKPDFHLF